MIDVAMVKKTADTIRVLSAEAIQKAIDDCKENQMVYIPEGDFMTGSLFLHSDMELFLDKGAIIHGTVEV